MESMILGVEIHEKNCGMCEKQPFTAYFNGSVSNGGKGEDEPERLPPSGCPIEADPIARHLNDGSHADPRHRIVTEFGSVEKSALESVLTSRASAFSRSCMSSYPTLP